MQEHMFLTENKLTITTLRVSFLLSVERVETSAFTFLLNEYNVQKIQNYSDRMKCKGGNIHPRTTRTASYVRYLVRIDNNTTAQRQLSLFVRNNKAIFYTMGS